MHDLQLPGTARRTRQHDMQAADAIRRSLFVRAEGSVRISGLLHTKFHYTRTARPGETVRVY
jgi:hypothetical protein